MWRNVSQLIEHVPANTVGGIFVIAASMMVTGVIRELVGTPFEFGEADNLAFGLLIPFALNFALAVLIAALLLALFGAWRAMVARRSAGAIKNRPR